MGFILEPLEKLGITGILMESGDGAVCDCYPLLAAYSGDYLEQVLITCTKTGECPTCPTPRDEMGNPESATSPRKIGPVLDALDRIVDTPAAFSKAC